jgi:hypothetical protein
LSKVKGPFTLAPFLLEASWRGAFGVEGQLPRWGLGGVVQGVQAANSQGNGDWQTLAAKGNPTAGHAP